MEDLILDFALHKKVRVATTDAAQARRDARRADLNLRELHERVGRLTLACTAMWDLLRDRAGLTDEDLLSYMQEVDLRDGSTDGQHRPSGQPCPSCTRMNNVRHRQCMYCESPLPGVPLP